MLLPYLKTINDKKIILGSQSKSRNELMQTQRIKYQIIPSKFAEDLDKASFPSASDYNLQTVRGKVDELLARFKQENVEWDVLICGDTIVQHKGIIIEKTCKQIVNQENQEHCIQMIGELSNNTHRIYTANTIVFNSSPLIRHEWVCHAEVTFGKIDPEIIKQFAKEPEPYLHSGGYEDFCHKWVLHHFNKRILPCGVRFGYPRGVSKAD